MPLYWARFVNGGSNGIFRLDTRVYLHDVARCMATDFAIGAVVAKNPGSARPSDVGARALQPIALENDKLIPTVRSLVAKSYREAQRSPPKNGYIQVLNLFYLCDKQFNRAIRAATQMVNPRIDPAETKPFPWVMYLWGEFENRKARFIRRFSELDSQNHFYFDKNLDDIVCDVPGDGSFAKHTQGLNHEPVVQHLASLITSA